MKKFGGWLRKRGLVRDNDDNNEEEEEAAVLVDNREKRKRRRWLWRRRPDEEEAVDDGSTGEKKEKKRRRGLWWAKGEKGVRLLTEFATAWAVTKALLPLRLLVSVWLTPVFARGVVVPFGAWVAGGWWWWWR